MDHPFGEDILDERRTAARKQYVARGHLHFPDGRKVAIRTFDASATGLGFTHEDALPATDAAVLLTLNAMTLDGAAAVIKAEVQVRHSVVGRGLWRSGLLFARIEDAHKRLLEQILAPRIARID